MTHTLITIQPNGTRTEAFGKPTLDTLQAAVGGYIETIGFFDKFEGRKCKAYANETGALTGLPFNQTATQLWAAQYPHWSHLVGPVVIVVKGKLAEGEAQ